MLETMCVRDPDLNAPGAWKVSLWPAGYKEWKLLNRYTLLPFPYYLWESVSPSQGWLQVPNF